MTIRQELIQIFSLARYLQRKNYILKSILSVCAPDTRLCVAVNLTTEEETIISKTVAQWKKEHIDLHKKPAIFLISR